MMDVLVIGYYDRSNLGDEMFKLVLPKIFPSFNLTFVCIDDINNKLTDSYKAIICGGGDIINDYFHKRFLDILKYFDGPIFAVGVGIPYPGLIKRGHLDIFDHVFIRERTDLLKLQRRLGSSYVHYLPDLGFALNSPFIPKKNKNNQKRIGVFLAQSLFKYKSVVYSLTRFLEEVAEKHKVILYRFNTSNSLNEDDKYINKEIYDFLSSDYPNLENDENVYDVEQMLNIMSELDAGICMRFHSHIFATISELPFFSIYSTRKVGLYVDEEDYKWKCMIETETDGKQFKFNYKQEIVKFNELIDNEQNLLQVRDKLQYIKNKYKFLLDTQQADKLLLQKRKRPQMYDPLDIVNINDLYIECSDILKKKVNYDPREGKKDILDNNNNSIITGEIATEVATKLCMELTGIPSSKYLFGTIKNIVQKPWDLREMIKWIFKDFSEGYNLSCNRLYFDSYCQDAFRGVHRSGWQYVIDYMKSLACFNGVICDVYCDLTFLWGNNILKDKGIIPYTSPWVGFIHHSPNEIYSEYNTVELIKNKEFRQSLIVCKGLICLTEHLSSWFRTELEKIGYSVPIYTFKHPTIIPDLIFSNDDFLKVPIKRLINVGAWYRNPFTIHRIDPMSNFEKFSLKGKDMDNYFCPANLTFTRKDIEIGNTKNKWVFYMFEYIRNLKILDRLPLDFEITLGIFNDVDLSVLALNNHLYDLKNSTKTMEYLKDDEYDRIFSESVVFLDLVDASAANTIIECIVRNTPLLVNKISPVVEYLGEEYPLYYNDIKEISDVLTFKNIQTTTEYLKCMNKKFLTIEDFIDNIRTGPIYPTLIDSSI
jgi:polysaccharide pyruvyl transferase WcaK-like protein